MRLLFLGDVVGRSGRKAVVEALPGLRGATSSISSSSTARTRPAASASPRRSCEELLDAGADAVTLGNHAFDQKEALVFIERHDRAASGRSTIPRARRAAAPALLQAPATAPTCWSSTPWAASSCPSSTPVPRHRRRAHGLPAEAGRRRHRHRLPRRGDEREAGDGLLRRRPRHAASSARTRTRRPPTSACCRAAPPTCRDAGMCGDYNSVLGMDTEEPINRFLTKIPRERFEPAMGPATLSGLAVEIDDETGLATRPCGGAAASARAS